MIPAAIIYIAITASIMFLVSRASLKPYFRGPIVVYIVSWTLTTSIAAIFIIDGKGMEALRLFLGNSDLNFPEDTFGGFYYYLLFAPIIIFPVFYTLSFRAMPKPSIMKFLFSRAGASIYGVSLTLIVISIYVIASLYSVGFDLWGNIANYEDNILERYRLMNALGGGFYGVFYSAIPCICAICAPQILARSDKTIYWSAIFVCAFLLFSFVSYVTLLKAPIFYMMISVVSAIYIAKATLMKRVGFAVGLGSICVALFLTLQLSIGGIAVQTSQQVDNDVSDRLPTAQSYLAASTVTARNLVFRMGSAFPFYVNIFSEPDERCDIEVLPGPERCNLPTKVFKEMYPDLTFASGFAPAAAHVSAYGEAGILFASAVMIISGILLGAASSTCRYVAETLKPAYFSAIVMFAYFLTQVPLHGAILYSHGAIYFALTIIFVALSSFVFDKLKSLR